MTDYRRNFLPGGSYFFTVNLADRRGALLTDHIDSLRAAFRQVRARHPFTIEAAVVLPDHLHAIWTLPDGDADFATRWRLIKSGFSIRAQIIWAKERLVMSRGDYHWQHEPCWYAARQGPASWKGDRKQSTLWQITAREGPGFEHGTQKPVECMKRPIENNSSPGQAIYEPFSGSGTTIIAAEITGRVCHAIELLGQYVDVAIQRWQSFTGQSATLDGDGRSFTEVAGERRPAELPG